MGGVEPVKSTVSAIRRNLYLNEPWINFVSGLVEEKL